MSFSLSSWFDARFFKTGNNAPLTGGKIYTYLAGTTTPVATYSNDSGATNTNPIILDADGRANIYLDDSVAYRFILKDANNITQKDVDNVRSSRVDIVQKASTIADLRLLTGTSANSNAVATLGYYVAGDGGGNTFYWDSSSGATDNGGTVIKPTAVLGTGRWIAVDSSNCNVRQFGAKGNGTTDDTNSITSALNNSKNIDFPYGTYLVSSTIILPVFSHKLNIFSKDNATVKVVLGSSIDFLRINSKFSISGIKFDFNNGFVRYGFTVAASSETAEFVDCVFKNVLDADSTTGTIILNITSQDTNVSLKNLSFINMKKRGNLNVTDAAGSLNCIYITNNTNKTIADIDTINASEIHNIDSLGNIIYEDTAVIYIATGSSDSYNTINITNINGYNFGKRLLKIHASNVFISNVVGNSQEGDSLGVYSGLTGGGLGDKKNNTITNAYAFGKMEYAFSSAQDGTVFNNISASITVGTKSGMSTSCFGVLVNGSQTLINNATLEAKKCIGIGSSTAIIKKTTITNTTLNITNNVEDGIYDISGNIGISDLNVSKLTINHTNNSAAGLFLFIGQYFNGTTIIGENFVFRDILVYTSGLLNTSLAYILRTQKIVFDNVKYINTSGNSHFRIIAIESSSNSTVSNIEITGTNQIGVFLNNCTGQNTASNLYNPSSTTATLYNNNTNTLTASFIDTTKVSGNSLASYPVVFYQKNSTVTTANRPTVGLVVGQQVWDTTLAKPIWWNGSVWKDAANTTV